MHSIHELLDTAIEQQASDLILKTGVSPMIRVDGRLSRLDQAELSAETVHQFALEALCSADRDRLVRRPDALDADEATEAIENRMRQLQQGREQNVAFNIGRAVRVRAHLYLERCQIGAALRLLPRHVPTPDQLGLPEVCKRLVQAPRGLVILGGPPGMGKTTSLAALIDAINSERQASIVTLEAPIEYLHSDRQSIIQQRELGQDTESLSTALAGIAREGADVAILGELWDAETTEAAVRLAARGCLVLTTLQAGSITDALSQIIGRFPAATRPALCQMLSDALLGVTMQVLIPCSRGSGRVAATEVLTNSSEVRSRLRQGESWDFGPFIRAGADQGMNTLNQALEHLCRTDAISCETAAQYTRDPAELTQLLRSR
jgi:twitching motility protein PilT